MQQPSLSSAIVGTSWHRPVVLCAPIRCGRRGRRCCGRGAGPHEARRRVLEPARVDSRRAAAHVEAACPGTGRIRVRGGRFSLLLGRLVCESRDPEGSSMLQQSGARIRTATWLSGSGWLSSNSFVQHAAHRSARTAHLYTGAYCCVLTMMLLSAFLYCCVIVVYCCVLPCIVVYCGLLCVCRCVFLLYISV